MAEPHPDSSSPEAVAASRTYGPVDPEASDRALIERLTAERDRYAAMLLSAEQEFAKRPLGESGESGESGDLEWYRDALLAVVNSRSWRVTRPLRAFGRLTRGRSSGQTEA